MSTIFVYIPALSRFARAGEAGVRLLDQQAIYLLIAGTYTPFTLVTLKGRVGWWLFGAIRGCTACGICVYWPAASVIAWPYWFMFETETAVQKGPAPGFCFLQAGR
ncbi:MAG: hemolysin III family protein [Thiohalophilus sp.]